MKENSSFGLSLSEKQPVNIIVDFLKIKIIFKSQFRYTTYTWHMVSIELYWSVVYHAVAYR